MFNSTLLDVFIGLAFFYLLLSLVLASINEMISGFFKLRNGMLEKAIAGMLGNDELIDLFYDHPLLRGISRKRETSPLVRLVDFMTRSRLMQRIGIAWLFRKFRLPAFASRIVQGRPSYISSRNFAVVMTDLLGGEYAQVKKRFGGENDIDRKQLKKLRDDLGYFTELIDAGGRDDATSKLAAWYDDQMERVSGWYKRFNQKLLVLVAMVVTVFLNADTLMMANLLWNDSVLREAVVLEAQATVERANTAAEEKPVSGTATITRDEVDETPCTGCREPTAVDVAVKSRSMRPFPVGWVSPSNGLYEELRSMPYTFAGWIYKGLGLLITTILVSLGAPFWFDMLSKLVNFRTTGIKPKGQQPSAGVAP